MEIEELPLISVIVPIYNSEKYLDRCIGSICKQTYTNLEIILVNDGSLDNSLEVCEKFAGEDDRILIKDIANGGVSNARNVGILSSLGEYIQFLDSDDFMLETYISVLYNHLKSHQADMVICSIQDLDNDLNKLDYKDAKNHVLDLSNPDKEGIFNLFDKFLIFGPVNKLFKKSILKDNSILYDTTISYGEDLLLNLEYLKYSKKIVCTNQVYWPYVQDNSNSLSNKRRDNKIEILHKLHNGMAAFFERIGCVEECFEVLLHHRMFDYCYNESFAIANDENFTFLKKRKVLCELLKDKSLKDSYPFVKANKYARWVIVLMKNRLATLFLILIKLISRKK